MLKSETIKKTPCLMAVTCQAIFLSSLICIWAARPSGAQSIVLQDGQFMSIESVEPTDRLQEQSDKMSQQLQTESLRKLSLTPIYTAEFVTAEIAQMNKQLPSPGIIAVEEHKPSRCQTVTVSAGATSTIQDNASLR